MGKPRMTAKPRPDSSSWRKSAAASANDGAGKSAVVRVEISRPDSRTRRRAESSSHNAAEDRRWVQASGLAKSARRQAPRPENGASCIGVTAAIIGSTNMVHAGWRGCPRDQSAYYFWGFEV